MAIEIEKKYRLNELQREIVLKNLAEIGAEYKGEDFEENLLFYGGILVEKQAVLRLRKIGEKTILTYKEKIQNESGIKHYREHETETADFEESVEILESLGFYRSLVYEKRRRTWHFRDVEIVLDELPFGSFMEIEGSITAIEEAEIFLEAEDFETEHETYPHLTHKFGKKNGNLIEARFNQQNLSE
ncbi:MAG: class IV adenylate cyclase [Pyrinomonadaceae bacterium]|nr:class IV adenylate cyclase [Pyrinomonadaceae bacterium]